MPLLWNAKAGANMVTHPVPAISRAGTGKDIKAGLKPIIEAVRDLDGFVLGVVGWQHAILDGLAAVNCEVAMQLDHGVTGLDLVVGVDLDFVVVLSARGD